MIFEAINTYGVNNLKRLVKPENEVTTIEETSNESQEDGSEEVETTEGEENPETIEVESTEQVDESATEENSAE